MSPSTQEEYLSHLKQQFSRYASSAPVQRSLKTYIFELVTLTSLSFDTVRDQLATLYCPTGQGAPYDPCCMLRSLILMTLCRETSPDAWATRLKREPVLSILAGFVPHKTPCATAHRDFLIRFADGPYHIRKLQDKTLSQHLKGRHHRRLEDATKARQEEAKNYSSQSDAIATHLLAHADEPRDPNTLQTRLENLFVELGLKPSLDAGLFGETTNVISEGDGTTLASAASPNGKRTCDCAPNSKDCAHPRLYTSATAQWCKDAHHDTWIFGDRSYTISVHLNHHDLPLVTIMPGGNESDFTLSLKALDDLLKMIREYDLPLNLTIFLGDGHHDALPIYRYLKEKGIIPVIPLKEAHDASEKPSDTPAEKSSHTTSDPASERSSDHSPDHSSDHSSKTPPEHPHLKMYPNIMFDEDGTPLCPGGCRMRHFQFVTRKNAHYYICPAQHGTRSGYLFHPEECPFAKNCHAEKKLGHTLYIKSEADIRLFPPISRDSKQFKTLVKERSGTERGNSTEDSYKLDRCCRNAAYGLIRLTVVNICKHAVLRWLELQKTQSDAALLDKALRVIASVPNKVKLLE
jgi:hypothetical protein